MATEQNAFKQIKGIGERRVARLLKLGMSDADARCRFEPGDY